MSRPDYTGPETVKTSRKRLFEAEIIEKYLPQQMSPEEITEKIRHIIAQTGAVTIKDMGRVMGAAAKELAGKADNKTISEIVKRLLGG